MEVRRGVRREAETGGKGSSREVRAEMRTQAWGQDWDSTLNRKLRNRKSERGRVGQKQTRR